MTTPKALARRQAAKDEAAAVLTAAAGLATTVIASAATDATKQLAEAAANATKAVALAAATASGVVADAATKALAEFPRLQEDIREVRAAQTSETATIVNLVTSLIGAHTMAEEERLRSIDGTVTKIEKHMVRQNGRLTTVETHITRQNLVIFGIAGPVSLAVIGYFMRALFILWQAAPTEPSPRATWELLVGLSLGMMAFGYFLQRLRAAFGKRPPDTPVDLPPL
jgi:hypothetical protein